MPDRRLQIDRTVAVIQDCGTRAHACSNVHQHIQFWLHSNIPIVFGWHFGAIRVIVGFLPETYQRLSKRVKRQAFIIISMRSCNFTYAHIDWQMEYASVQAEQSKRREVRFYNFNWKFDCLIWWLAIVPSVPSVIFCVHFSQDCIISSTCWRTKYLKFYEHIAWIVNLTLNCKQRLLS